MTSPPQRGYFKRFSVEAFYVYTFLLLHLTNAGTSGDFLGLGRLDLFLNTSKTSFWKVGLVYTDSKIPQIINLCTISVECIQIVNLFRGEGTHLGTSLPVLWTGALVLN